MTKQEIGSIERQMALKFLMELARNREGATTELTPCGLGKYIEDGFTVEDMFNGKIKYMLWYNVGCDTHAVSLDVEKKAE